MTSGISKEDARKLDEEFIQIARIIWKLGDGDQVSKQKWFGPKRSGGMGYKSVEASRLINQANGIASYITLERQGEEENTQWERELMRYPRMKERIREIVA